MACKIQLLWLKGEFVKKYAIKFRGILGPDADEVTQISHLNKLITLDLDKQEIRYEADPRHVDIIVKQAGVANARSVVTPIVRLQTLPDKPTSPGGDDCEPEVEISAFTFLCAFSACEASGHYSPFFEVQPGVVDNSAALSERRKSNYISLAMRGQYLSADRLDVLYATKELSRKMSSPTELDDQHVKRYARFLKGKPRVVTKYPWQQHQGYLKMYSDTDDAGRVSDRKSTSCGVLMHGCHLISSYASTQRAVSLSSGESEFYGAVRAASHLLGAKAMGLDLGEDFKLKLLIDATACKGMVNRKGFGKAKHIARCFLWIQQRIRDKEIEVDKVSTLENIADIGTKPLEATTLEKLMNLANQFYEGGRHELGLNV